MTASASGQQASASSLNREVLKVDLGSLEGITSARATRRLPTVLDQDELARLFTTLNPPYLLMAQLLYGSGLRWMECCCLRVKDLDFSRRLIVVRESKGGRDRVVPLPDCLRDPLRSRLEISRRTPECDLKLQPSGADQAAVTLGDTDDEIGGLTISDPPTQAAVQALRGACEQLADNVRALAVLVHTLRGALVATGMVKGGA